MQLQQVCSMLEEVPDRKFTSGLMRSLRKDDQVWSFLLDANEESSNRIAALLKQKKINPGTLGLFALSEDLVENGYPQCSLQVSVLEDCMVHYEGFLQQRLPPLSLADSARLAVALIEKKKVTQTWRSLFQEIIERMHLIDRAEFKTLCKNIFAVAVNLCAEDIAFLSALLESTQPEIGIDLFVHTALCLPYCEIDLVERIYPLTAQLNVDVIEALLMEFVHANENIIARNLAQKIVAQSTLFSSEPDSNHTEPETLEALTSQVLLSKQRAAILQIAGDDDSANILLQKSLVTLDELRAGMEVQRLSTRGSSDLVLPDGMHHLFSETGQHGLAQEYATLERAIPINQEGASTAGHPLVNIARAKEMKQAGNEVMARAECKKTITQVNRADLEVLVNFQPRYHPTWTPNEVVDSLLEMGAIREAQFLAEMVLAANPASKTANQYTARAYLASGEYAKALPLLQTLSLDSDSDPQVKRSLALGYQKTGDIKAAYRMRKELIQGESPQLSDLLDFADAAVDHGKPDEAFEALQKVISEEEHNTRALSIRGKAYASVGKVDEAVAAFNHAIELGTDNVEPWLGLSALLETQNRHFESIETLRRGMVALPSNHQIKKQLAKYLISAGAISDALPLLNSLQASTSDLETDLLRLEALKKLGLKEYHEEINSLYQKQPYHPQIARLQAEELIRDGKQQEARKIILEHTDVEHLDDSMGLIYADSVVGFDVMQSGEPKKLTIDEEQRVNKLIEDSLAINPDNCHAQLLKAEMLISAGKPAQAHEIYGKLLANKALLDAAWFERVQSGFAWTAALMGKFETALAAINQAIEWKPDWSGLKKMLARIYALAGEIGEAIEQAGQVLESGSNLVENLLWFTDFATELGKVDLAESKLVEAVALRQGEILLHSKLAEIQMMNGKSEDARKTAADMQAVLSNDLSEEEFIAAAQTCYLVGNSDAALTCLRQRAGRFPSLSAHLDLAGLEYSLGQYDASLTDLQSIDQDENWNTRLDCLKAVVLIEQGDLENAQLVLDEISEKPELDDHAKTNLLPSRWQQLIIAPNPVLQLKSSLLLLRGQPAQSHEVARQWCLAEPENIYASLACYESAFACGKSENISIENMPSSEMDPSVSNCLMAIQMDAMLEDGQVLEAQQLYEKIKDDRDMCLRIMGLRIAAVSAHLDQAEADFDSILADFEMNEDEDILLRFCAKRLLAKTAVTLQRWDDALSIQKKVVSQFEWHQGFVMQYLRSLVQAQEFHHLTTSLAMTIHTPEKFLQDIHLIEEVEWLLGLTHELDEEEVKRWMLRAQLAEKPDESAIRAFALITPTAEDAAALVTALYRNGQVETAVQVAEKHPEDGSVLFALADLLSFSDSEKAIAALNKWIGMDAINPVALAFRAMIYENTGKTDLAINDLEQAIADWPNETGWRLKTAELWQHHGNNQNALAQLSAAFELIPEDEPVTLALARALCIEGEYQRAVDLLTPLTARNPNCYQAWEILSEARAAMNDMPNAIECAQKASQINPFSTKPYLMTGKLYLAQGLTDQALEQAREAVKQNKKDAEAVLFLARVLHTKGEKRQALSVLETTNRCENVTAQTMIDHIHLVGEINGTSSARELIESISGKYPENLELMKMLVQVQIENGDVSQAEITAKRALLVEPDDPDLHMFLGKINAESGQLDQAVHHLSQGIAQHSQNLDGYLTLSKVYQQQRDFTNALEALKLAMQAVPSDKRSYLAAAALYRDSKNYTEAEKALQQAVEIDPKDVTIRRQLGALLALKLVHHTQEASLHS